MRLAKVKINKDYCCYICSDKLIEIGDVIYVNDYEYPLYVEDIIESNDYDHNKEVIRLATYNKNVKLTKKIFGKVLNADLLFYPFKEISKTTKYLDKYLDPKTQRGRIKVKEVTSFIVTFNNEDGLELLVDRLYLKITDAIKMGYKDIVIPYMGTDKGFDAKDIDKVLSELRFRFQYVDNIELNIISLQYVDKNKHHEYFPSGFAEGFRSCINSRSYSFIAYSKVEAPRFKIDRYVSIKELMDIINEHYNKNDEFDVSDCNGPIDFLRKYRKKVGYDKTSEVDAVMSPDSIKKAASGKRKIKKEEILQLAFALGLNYTEIIQFMYLAGYTFSTISEDSFDIVILEYIIEFNGFTKEKWEIYEDFEALGLSKYMNKLSPCYE